MNKTIELSLKNFEEASKTNGKEQFCFIIGDQQIFCHSFVAAFLSRKVLRNLLSDPTTKTYHFQISPKAKEKQINDELKDILIQLVQKGRFEINDVKIVEMKEELEKLSESSNSTEYANTLINSYIRFIDELDSDEIRQQFYSILFTSNEQSANNTENELKNKEEIEKQIKSLQRIEKVLRIIENGNQEFSFSKENIKIIYNKYFANEYSNFIDKVASHFFEIEEETIINLNSEILNDVLNSKKLKIKDEDSLLQILMNRRKFILQHSSLDSEEEIESFIEKVRFEYLTEKSIEMFIDEIQFFELNDNIWKSVCKRLILPVDPKIENERSLKQIVGFQYHDDQKFNGIFNHLTEITKGNIQDNQTIEIKCSHLCCGSLNSLVDFNNSKSMVHIFRNPKPRWIQFDFKSRKVQINGYIIKTSNQNDKYFRSWVFEISSDGTLWEKVDEKENVNELNGKDRVKSFRIGMTKPCRFIRFITDKPNFNNDDGFVLGHVEFFGNLISE